MEKLCIQYHSIDIGHGGIRIFAPGVIYDVEEFEDGEALVNGIWAPDYIFNSKKIKELSR